MDLRFSPVQITTSGRIQAGSAGRGKRRCFTRFILVPSQTRETFRAAIGKLPYLASLGITAVEIMPLAHFPGTRGWGYDGVLQFAAA